MKVNLLDRAFAHVPFSVPGRTSRHIEWVRDPKQWDGNSPLVITDDLIHHAEGIRLQGPLIGWLLEGRGYANANYRAAEKQLDRLDLLLTHDSCMLQWYPRKARFVPFGGCWIPDENWGMHNKTKAISHIYSGKNFMEGHKLRHEIGRRCGGVDHCGYGTNAPLVRKEDGLSPYEFSIVVENDRAMNYFTEKLIDCFAVGTIPIYWGCPNIGDFFDLEGIITFRSVDDLDGILAGMSYERHIEAAKRNMEIAREYVLPEDYIYEHVLRFL